MLSKRSEEDTNTKKKKDLYDFVEKTMLDKEQQKDINEEASKPGATIDKIDGNLGIGVSSTSKGVHESILEPSKEDVRTSLQQNDIVQSPSQAKRQKMTLAGSSRPPSAKAMVESMCSFYHEPSLIHEDIWKKLNEYWEAQTSVLPRSPQPSDKEE
ncbi:hypothetical protein R3W88_001042 [Solanum pinnatisectum]|uniref:Uncharacterized protein n=1 Tax=Solanum pinnatisectum TaxID=50273 RepID=A0AAV9MKF4_9SOLN|nr:hypothetical protein R3W88_001042 [Solanum pinnatisectum]